MNNVEIRKNLSKLHRIIGKLRMDDLTYTHLSARLEAGDEFLLSPFGIRFKYVKPKDLLQFKLTGELMPKDRSPSVYDDLFLLFGKKFVSKVLMLKEEEQPFNKTGFAIHSSIYKARKDVNCIIHLHTKETIAVASSKKGLLPASQHALHFYEKVSYHSYNSLVLTPQQEEEQLIRDLGENNVMLMQNHGFITMGKTIWEALFYAYHLQRACEVQVLLKEEDCIFPSHETCLKAREDLLSFEQDLGKRDFDSFQKIHNLFL
jgi:ribulose-5-phosphate 4-epimerase/fuculose-1-phosphate aldolase